MYSTPRRIEPDFALLLVFAWSGAIGEHDATPIRPLLWAPQVLPVPSRGSDLPVADQRRSTTGRFFGLTWARCAGGPRGNHGSEQDDALASKELALVSEWLLPGSEFVISD